MPGGAAAGLAAALLTGCAGDGGGPTTGRTCPVTGNTLWAGPSFFHLVGCYLVR